MTRRYVATVVGLLVLLLGVAGAAVALGPLVRLRAAEAGARRGVEVVIGEVKPGWGGVHLTNVLVSSADSKVFDASLERVAVRLNWNGSVQAIDIQGGAAILHGRAREVRDWFRRSQDVRGTAESSGAAAARKMSVSGVSLSWPDLIQGGGALEVREAFLLRDHAGEWRLGAAEVSASKGGVELSAKGLSLETVREGSARRIGKLGIGRLDVRLKLGRSGEGRDGEQALGTIEASQVDPAASGRTWDPGELRERVVGLASSLAGVLGSEGTIGSEQLFAQIRHAEQVLNIGPARLRIGRESTHVFVEVVAGGSEGRAPLDLHLKVPAGAGEMTLKLQGGPITLASLGVHDGELGIVGVKDASLKTSADIVLSSDAETLSFDADGQLSSFGLLDRRLADEPIREMELGWRAKGSLQTDGSAIRVEVGELGLGAIRFKFEGQLVREDGALRANTTWTIPLVACQEMLDSLPKALIPQTAEMALRGSFAMKGKLAFDMRKLDALDLDWQITEPCRIASVPSELSVARFRRPFRRMVYDADGGRIEILSGPGTASWTPLQEISPYVEAAVMTTEDGRFRRHNGFDKEAIKSSARDNLKAGRFVRGASTISMQLAKNLYLDRGKTLSRKLQEVLLTAYLEQELTKDELMELYLNIVELGPMIYGIGPAAEHYFGTSSHDLSLGQALYLVSTLPNPKRQYFGPDGRVVDRWMNYLQRLMRTMLLRHRITERELADGLSEIVTFGMAQSPRREGFVERIDDLEDELGEAPLIEGP